MKLQGKTFSPLIYRSHIIFLLKKKYIYTYICIYIYIFFNTDSNAVFYSMDLSAFIFLTIIFFKAFSFEK